MSCPQISWCTLEEVTTPEKLCPSPTEERCSHLETQLPEHEQIPNQRYKKQQREMLLSMLSTGPGQGRPWLWDKCVQSHKSGPQAELQAEMMVVSSILHHSMECEASPETQLDRHSQLISLEKRRKA